MAKTGKKKIRKNVIKGIAHVKASFNNTQVTITDVNGETLAWDSAGTVGFKGARKSTPFAAGRAAEKAAAEARKHGMVEIEVKVKGPGAGREQAILNLQNADTELSKRLIDFASGLTYALDGSMQRVADKVFLLTPRNVEVSAEERARALDPTGGFFNQA